MGAQRDLGALERTAREVAAEWGLELGAPFTLSRHSYVAPAGDNAVLKVTSADDDESDEEADALALWDGNGAVRLLRHSRERRALLVERARPGTDIAALPEEEATAVAVETGRRLWRPPSEPFRWIGDHVPRWLAQAEESNGSATELIPLARELYASLDPRRSTLVHGDFHHHNILDATGRYVAIDPKPMLGEPEFDVPPFLWNPMQTPIELDTTEQRLAAFAAAGLDEKRMRAWSVIRGAYLRVERENVEVLRALG
jgi:streptomycin 6-kinase